MTHPLTERAIALHEAARLLFVDFQTTMPPDERARLYGMHGKLRVDNGSRELLGSIVVPPAPHEPDCDCVACEPRHAAR